MITLTYCFTGCGADIHVIPKIESADSIPNLHSIIAASDGVIVLLFFFYFFFQVELCELSCSLRSYPVTIAKLGLWKEI